MKIYNVMKVPQGLGYDDVDYDAIYQSGYTAGYDDGYNDYECAVATALTFGIYDFCTDSYIENGIIELRETGLPTQVLVSPSGVPVDLVYTSSNPSLVSVSSAGVLDCVTQIPWEEVTITVYDNISRLTASASCFVDSTPYMWVLEPNNCPCTDYGYTNGCGCVPASGGTFRQEVVLSKPKWTHSTAINVISTPEWITVSPTSAAVGCYDGTIVMNMTVAPCSEVATASGEQRTGTIVLGENGVCGLTLSVDVSQYKLEAPEEPKLYITHNFPAEEGQYREVPQTGATYTMTISGNTNWSANTVNFGSGVLCTLSQNSGAANESVIVTVTFPETSSTKQGLIELGASPMPEDGYTQDVNYFVFQFRQEGLPQ